MREGDRSILTPAQRKTLLRYREHRDDPFTLSDFLVPMWPQVANVAIVIAAAIYIMPDYAMFLAAFLEGVLMKQAAIAVHALRIIPAVLRVVDWKEVDHLLE